MILCHFYLMIILQTNYTFEISTSQWRGESKNYGIFNANQYLWHGSCMYYLDIVGTEPSWADTKICTILILFYGPINNSYHKNRTVGFLAIKNKHMYK